MKKVLIPVVLTVLVGGCATPSFYTNGVLDAMVSTEITQIDRVKEENRQFNLYKLNGDRVALSPKMGAPSSTIAAVSQSLILSKEQVESLLGTCEQISSDYDNKNAVGAKIIEVHLTLNRTEMRGSSSSYASQAFGVASASTVTSIREINPVVFRLQYDRDGSNILGSGKDIRYLLWNTTGTLSIADLRSLMKDLRK